MGEIGIEFPAEVTEVLNIIKPMADEKWLPYVDEFDRLGGAQVAVKMPDEWMALWEAFREHKLLGLTVPKKYGGRELNLTNIGIILHEAVRYGLSVSYPTFMCQNELAGGLLRQATEELRSKYMKRMMEGAICSLFGTEPNAGTDYGSIETTAVRDGDNYVINGQKWFVGNPDPGPWGLNFGICPAKTDPTQRLGGLTMFIVDCNSPGMLLGREGDQVGLRVYPRYEVALKDVVVPKENVVGAEGEGGRVLVKMINHTYGNNAWEAVGIARTCLDYCLEYTKKREQFGGPISDYQGVHYVLADMAIGCEAGWAISHRATSAWDDEPDSRGAITLLAAAKVYSAEMGVDVTTEGMKLLAGRGYERGEGHPIERLWRDALMFTLLRTGNLDRRYVAQNYLGKKLKAGFLY